MRLAAIAYVIGALCALAPPAPPHTLALSLAGLAVAAVLRGAPRVPAAFCLGLAWTGLATNAALATWLPPALEDQTLVLGGRIDTFPMAVAGAVAFELDQVERRGRAVPGVPPRVRVSWRGAPALGLGDWCELRVRLRRPHGLANPGGRARETTALVHHLGAVGYVVAHPANLCAPIADRNTLHGLRAWLSHSIARAVPDGPSAAVLRALAVDDRSALTSTQWEVMRRTGTAHLIAISGLQITLVAGWCFVLSRVTVAALCARKQLYPAVRAGWYGSVAAACAYTAIAGSGVPSVRAAVMVGCAAVAALCGRRALSWDTLLGSLVALVICDPLCLLGSGLWLSYCAVAVLIVIAERAGDRGWRAAWRTHVAMTLALAPLTAVLFGAVPLVAPFANLIAVAWTNIFVVPLTVVGMLCAGEAPALAAFLWDCAARLWAPLYTGLEWLAQAPALPTQQIDVPGAALALCGLALLALPRAVPVRLLGSALLVAVLLPRTAALRTGEFTLLLLDVGQGLAIVIETADHALLYDTGPRWWDGSGDAGDSIIVPALHARGVRRLERLLVSHADLDHAGGAASVLRQMPVATVMLAEPVASLRGTPRVPCAAPARWALDGVDFEVLHPAIDTRGTRNERSCVLAVRGAYGRALLAADIEAATEQALVTRVGAALAADVLSVPHHGSATSSTPAFVAAVHPALALIGAGYHNRYGLPQAAVVARYRAAGARVLNTAATGAVEVRVGHSGVQASGYRATHWGFWQQPER